MQARGEVQQQVHSEGWQRTHKQLGRLANKVTGQLAPLPCRFMLGGPGQVILGPQFGSSTREEQQGPDCAVAPWSLLVLPQQSFGLPGAECCTWTKPWPELFAVSAPGLTSGGSMAGAS